MKSILLIALLKLQAMLPLGVNRRLGSWLGTCLWRLDTRMARTTRTNLDICFPAMSEPDRLALAKNSLRESCKTMMEGGASWCWPPDRILSTIREVHNRQLLEDAVQSGKGVLVMSPHLCNWEIIGLWLGRYGGAETVQLYQAPKNARLGAILFTGRSRTGARMVDSDTRGVAALLKALRQGAISGILPDQVPPDSGGGFAPFFGRPALTMTLVSRLVEKTRCTVLLAHTTRLEERGRAGFRLSFREMDPRIYSSDLAVSLAGLNASIEQAILESPALYHWEYKRFRRQPDGMERPY